MTRRTSLAALPLAIAVVASAGAPSLAADCVDRLQLLLPGMTALSTNPGYSGAPLPQVVGIPFNAVVNLRDKDWDPCTSNLTPHTVQLSSATDPNVSFPGGATSSFTQSHTYQVVFGAAGSHSITSADLSHPIVSPTVCPVALVQSLSTFTTSQIGQVGTNPLTLIAGAPFSISVWAKDPAGATVGGYVGTALFSETTSNGDGSASPANANFSQGTWSGQGVLYRADESTSGGIGHANFRISASEVAAVGLSNAVVVLPGSADRLQILLPGETPAPGVRVSGAFPGKSGWASAQTAGVAFSVRVNATDAYWNRVSSVSNPVYFSCSDPAASLPATSPGNAVLLSGGQGTWNVILNTSGTHTLSVHDAASPPLSSNTSAQVMVVPGGSTPTVTQGTPVPTPTAPGGTSTPAPTATAPGPTATAQTAPPQTAEALPAPGTFWNFPNPFAAGRESTLLSYVLPAGGATTIRVYDLFGGLVASFAFRAGEKGGAAGMNRVAWDGLDPRGRALGAGSYVALLESRSQGRSTAAVRKLGIRP